MAKRNFLFTSAMTAVMLTLSLVHPPENVQAQGSGLYGSGWRVNLDTTGRKYFRLIVWNQVWARYQEFNPGSAVNGEPAKDYNDIMLRRSRFLIYGQLSPDNLLMFHIGINNQTFTSGGDGTTPAPSPTTVASSDATGPGKKPQLFIHDLWYEQRVIEKSLYLGFGLSYWWGISRMTNASTLNFLAIDAPIFNWPLIETGDQFARQYAIYAKGKIEKLDYRVALSQPFRTSDNAGALSGSQNVATFYNAFRTKAVQGYFMYQFLDQESNVLPFTVGSYLGTKTVFNIGAGFYFHPDAMRYRKLNPVGSDTTALANQALFGADVFLDYPFGEGDNKMAVTVYGVYYNYDFGPNYIRNIGIASIAGAATGSAASPQNTQASGVGASFPHVGTGSIFHLEAGLLLPPNVPGIGKLQPYATFTYSKFNRLNDPMVLIEGGVNWFLEGHHAKFTLHYRNRPVFKQQQSGTDVVFNGPDGLAGITIDSDAGRKSELILQAMIYF